MLGVHVPLSTHSWRIALVFLAATLCLSGCSRSAALPAIVGTCLVQMPTAAYPYHLFTFHADGTVIQSNPEDGDPRHSDSNLMGAWTTIDGHVAAKLVETAADRTTATGNPDGAAHAFIFNGGDWETRMFLSSSAYRERRVMVGLSCLLAWLPVAYTLSVSNTR